MRAITIPDKYTNKRVDNVISMLFAQLPQNALYKAFRKKDIKVNGIRVKENCIVSTRDLVEIYIADDILEGKPRITDGTAIKGFNVVYEDENIIIVNKKQGIPVHPDRTQKDNSLIDLVAKYLNGTTENMPSLCHRLDRNTGGLIILAKNSESLKIILDKIKNNEIKKYYQCLVKGQMPSGEAVLKAYLKKNEKQSKVYISDIKLPGWFEITTKYKVLEYKGDISRLDIELMTGRTHQIRAHLAHIGHPVLGDGKYGSNAINRPLGLPRQALCAYKLIFDFKTPSGFLDYLEGKEFSITTDFGDIYRNTGKNIN